MSKKQAQLASFMFPEKEEKTFNLKGTIAKYTYHWPLFVLFIGAALLGVFAYFRLSRPVYEVKAIMLIKDQNKTPDQKSALNEIDLLNSSTLLENEIEILKSNKLIGQVVDNLQLWQVYQRKDKLRYTDLYKNTPVKLVVLKETPEFEQEDIEVVIKDDKSFYMLQPGGEKKEYPFSQTFTNNFGTWKLEPTPKIGFFKGETIKATITDPTQVTFMYQKSIEIGVLNKAATAIELSIDDKVPQRGKDVLNQLVRFYNNAGREEKIRETKNTLDFLDQRIASLSTELNSAERGIEGFKSSQGLTDISSESKMNLEGMQANDAKLNEVNLQLSVIEGVEQYLNSSRNAGRAPATAGITDASLSSLTEKLSQLQLQREKLLATTPETNPDFEPINMQIASVKSAIKDNIRSIKTALINSRNQLQSYNSHFESSIKNIPTQERQFISIKRQQAIKENLYNYLLQKREEVAVSYASTLSNDRLIDQAYVGPAKNKKKAMFFMLALVAGICIPAGIIYIRGHFDDSVLDLREIKDQLDLPVLSEIPYQKGQTLISIDRSTTAISEQFGALRTKLYYLFAEKRRGRAILVTSSIPGEGKSFVCSNLAISLSNVGRKVVVLELDLRKPKIAETFKLAPGHLGITEYVEGRAMMSEIIQQPDDVPDLHIISSGASVDNPSKMVESDRLKELIESLRNQYDDVVIDSAPVHLVPDAMMLSRSTDITLYVVRQGYTGREELQFLDELNKQSQLLNINIVFNGIHRERNGYGYHYDNNYFERKKASVLKPMFSDFWQRF